MGSGVHVGTAVAASAVASISTGGWLSSPQATSSHMATTATTMVGFSCLMEQTIHQRPSVGDHGTKIASAPKTHMERVACRQPACVRKFRYRATAWGMA